MRKITIALCDTDTSYSRLFIEAAEHFSNGTVQVMLFSEPRYLLESIERRGLPDVILMKETIYELWQPDLQGAFLEKCLCMLTESRERTGIYMYQDMAGILMETQEFIDRNAGGSPERRVDLAEGAAGCELIGFYSPIHRTGQSTYARRMANEDGERNPVLFLSLEAYSGISPEGQMTLADMIYYMQQEELPFAKVLERVICKSGHIHEILPVPLPNDFWKISEQQWEILFRHLKEKSIYKKVYIDFGDGSMQKLFEVMDLCSVIYTPVAEDAIALDKLAQYERMLCMIGKESILQKTRRICLKKYGES